jgi:hypothetical protein
MHTPSSLSTTSDQTLPIFCVMHASNPNTIITLHHLRSNPANFLRYARKQSKHHHQSTGSDPNPANFLRYARKQCTHHHHSPPPPIKPFNKHCFDPNE